MKLFIDVTIKFLAATFICAIALIFLPIMIIIDIIN